MSPWFANLPSVNDLLETAPLKGMLEQVGRHRVVRETGQFLDRVRVEAQTAAQRILPRSPQELAQRVARWINTSAPHTPQGIVNATGVFYSPNCHAPPLAPEAIDAFTQTASNFQVANGWNEAIQAHFRELAGCEAAYVSGRASGALSAALAALAAQREVIVHRGELERDPVEPGVADLASATGASLREVGSINATSLSDFEAAIHASTGLLLRSELRWTYVAGSPTSPDISQLAKLAQQAGKPLLVDLGWGGLASGEKYGISGMLVAREVLKAGANIVLLRGHGFLGGPACGILLGHRDTIHKIAEHPLGKSSTATAAVAASLAATLQLHREGSDAEYVIPLHRMLATSAENLQQRAERLAPQIAATGVVAKAEAVATRASLTSRRTAEESLPSWSIALTPREGMSQDLATRLAAGSRGILGREENGSVLLDLRTVTPAEDLLLVDLIAALDNTGDTPR